MPTVGITVATTPVDLVAGLNLTAGAAYALQVQGNRPVLLHWSANAPATRPAPPHTRLQPAESALPVTIGDEGIWAWTTYESSLLSVSPIRQTLGPPRQIETVDISGGDYVRPGGFILQVGAAGTVVYTTLDGGNTSRTEVFGAAGVVSVAGIPVLLRAVHQAGTTTGLALTAGLL